MRQPVAILLCAGAASVVTLLSTPTLQAAGQTSAEFLQIGVGAPASQSGASGATARGAGALTWNPAGLTGEDRWTAYLSHQSLPDTVRYNFGALAVPWEIKDCIGATAISFQSLSQGSILQRNNTGTLVGDFTASDFAIGFSVAASLGDTRLGVTGRDIEQKIAGDSGRSHSLDLGLQRDFGFFSAGLALLNIGSPLAIYEESFPLPHTLRTGADIPLWRDLRVYADTSWIQAEDPRFHIGASYGLGPVTFRGGYRLGEKTADGPSGLSTGLGLEFRDLRVDLGYQAFGELGSTIQLGLGLKFEPLTPAALKKSESYGLTPDILTSPSPFEAQTIPTLAPTTDISTETVDTVVVSSGIAVSSETSVALSTEAANDVAISSGIIVSSETDVGLPAMSPMIDISSMTVPLPVILSTESVPSPIDSTPIPEPMEPVQPSPTPEATDHQEGQAPSQ